MSFLNSPEQRELAGSERSWLTKNDPVALLRPRIDEQPVIVDPRLRSHVIESGLAGILTSEAEGTHRDLAVLTAEHGRAASPLPLAELAIAAWLLEVAGDPAADLASAQAEGERLLSPAVGGPDGLTLTDSGDSVLLSGSSAPFVSVEIDSVVVVTDDDRIAVVSTDTAGIAIEPLHTLDLTRRWGRLTADGASLPSTSVFTLPPGTAARVRDAIAVHRVVDAVAAAERLLDMSVEYTAQREQFGVAIGTFQAVKHHCASMAVAVEASKAVLVPAIDALALPGSTDRARAVLAGVAYASDAASTVASTALQVHGGIGFTWEHDLHLLLRRIKVDENIDGTVRSRRRALASV